MKCMGTCPCKPRICPCPLIDRTVCGTDGKTYPNKCVANCANAVSSYLFWYDFIAYNESI